MAAILSLPQCVNACVLVNIMTYYTVRNSHCVMHYDLISTVRLSRTAEYLVELTSYIAGTTVLTLGNRCLSVQFSWLVQLVIWGSLERKLHALSAGFSLSLIKFFCLSYWMSFHICTLSCIISVRSMLWRAIIFYIVALARYVSPNTAILPYLSYQNARNRTGTETF